MKLPFACVPFIVVALFLLGLPSAKAQRKLNEIADPIASKMQWYGAKKRPLQLFVHFDKNVYTSSEYVWFSGYLLASKEELERHHTLAVGLIRNDDSAVLQSNKFLVGSGFSYGHFSMPDTLMPGSYSLVAYTNVLANGKPAVLFVQPITIKSLAEPTFNASLKLAEKILPGSDSAKLSFKAFAKDIRTLASFTDVSYTLNGLLRRFKTNFSGDAEFKVPLRGLRPGNNLLRLNASFKNENKKLQMALPFNNGQSTVRFFPEGGSLVAGNNTTIGWEVLDAYGQPMPVSAELMNGDRVVDTVLTNGYGMGKFVCAPRVNESWRLRLLLPGAGTDHFLPALHQQGVTVTIGKAVCNDTLVFRTETPQRGMYYGMIHSYTEHYLTFPMDLRTAAMVNFRVPLEEMPRGINTLTILNEAGMPVAERLFFAHRQQRTELAIQAHKEEYLTREKVELDIKLKDLPGNAHKGIVSVACVQDNRIDPRKMTDIESYSYLNHELDRVPFRKNAMDQSEESIQYWEDVLLIKGWRRYNWEDLMATVEADTLQPLSDVAFKGDVKLTKRGAKKPLELTIASDVGALTQLTDADGKFELKHEQLITGSKNLLLLFINGRSKDEYTIQLDDPYDSISGRLRKELDYTSDEAIATERSSDNLVIKKGEKADVLQEVIVTAKKKDASLFLYNPQKNACGDYVCQYGILNCSNHPSGGSVPQKGKSYRTSTGSPITYMGCAEEEEGAARVKTFKGILTAKEFYPIDYAKMDPAEQVFQSTLFWDYGLKVGTDSVAHLSFYTSDIPGRFRVIAQGVTTNGVVYAEKVFMVKKEEKGQ